ncbi:unnamed protein product [Symbiodinium necroappetens]|uniref:Transmembrane protein n=1 Tax=Symbiodinium necroappetens TaxID=1628268 RepID=A0A813BJP1_9DINO|nr:unnamed protein product [Symbiodinium necroappetens]
MSACSQLLSPLCPRRQPFGNQRKKRNSLITLLVFSTVVAFCVWPRCSCHPGASDDSEEGDLVQLTPQKDELRKVQDSHGLCCDSCTHLREISPMSSAGSRRIAYEPVKTAPTAVHELPCTERTQELVSICLGFLALSFTVGLSMCLSLCTDGQKLTLLEKKIDAEEAETCRLVVSGLAMEFLERRRWRPGGPYRSSCFLCCPLIDLACSFLACMLMLMTRCDPPCFEWHFAFRTCVTFLVVCMLLLALRCLSWLYCVMKFALASTASSKQTFEIKFAAFQEDAVTHLCVALEGDLLWLENIGNLPRGWPPRAWLQPRYLVRSQLEAHHKEDKDDQPIVAWSLQMYWCWFVQGEAHVGAWVPQSMQFPIDPAHVHDLHTWLAAEPHRRMFRYEGVAVTASEVLEWGFEHIHDRLSEQLFSRSAAFDRRQIFTLRCERHGSTMEIFLSMMSGKTLTLHASIGDLVADLCHRAALLGTDGSKVEVVLPDARRLGNLDPKLPLCEAFSDFCATGDRNV